jgi:hypothetical protein
MRRSPLTFVAAALLLGILVAGVFYYFYRTSPRFSLQQMVNSLTQRNYEKFYSYLDMKSVLGSLVEDTSKDLIPPEIIPRGNFWGELGIKIGSKFLQQLPSKAFETLQKDVFNKIINKYLDTLTTQDLLALQAAVTVAEIKRQEDVAQVILRFPKKDGRLRLTMSWDPQQRLWRVVSVSYEDLKQLLKNEFF